jgi:hypothetical protein
VMASHTKSELRWAAGVLARAIRAVEPVRTRTPAAARDEVQPEPAAAPVRASRVYDGLVEAA